MVRSLINLHDVHSKLHGDTEYVNSLKTVLKSDVMKGQWIAKCNTNENVNRLTSCGVERL